MQVALESPDQPEAIQLIADLDSADGKVRVAASKEIFRRGKKALAGFGSATRSATHRSRPH